MKKNIYKIIAIIAGVAAVACAAVGGYKYYQEKHAGDNYEEVRETVKKETEPAPVEEKAPVEIPIDFAALQEQNPEVYAWIQIQDTNIDYPILQREGDNGYYLDHTIDGEEKTEGSIFTEDYNSKDFEDPNTVIYGHDMKNGSMFQNLLSYQDKDFFDNHKDVIIYTPDAIRHYQVFAAYLYDDRHLMQSFDFNIKSVYQAYLDSIFAIRDMSAKIDTSQNVSVDDKIITLSTCYGNQSDKQEYAELEAAKARNELSLIEVKCSIGARDDLGRPTTTALENKVNFMNYLDTLK